jgi:vacuolar protein sorting-associated protein 13A/C
MAGLNINDAPVTFNAVVLEDLHTSPDSLASQLVAKYRGEALRQVHKIIGSADFIGNPVGLFNNISAGVQDVFYEPYQGILVGEGIQDLGLGLAKGARSLVKKTVFSLSDSVSKVTGSVSKGLSLATMDPQFQAKRRSNRSRNRPKHAIGGLSQGAKSLGSGVYSGVEGLALRPLEGAEKEGVGGFLKGVGKGIAGYVVFGVSLTPVLLPSLWLEFLTSQVISPKEFAIQPLYSIEILLIGSVDLDLLPKMGSSDHTILSKVQFNANKC